MIQRRRLDRLTENRRTKGAERNPNSRPLSVCLEGSTARYRSAPESLSIRYLDLKGAASSTYPQLHTIVGGQIQGGLCPHRSEPTTSRDQFSPKADAALLDFTVTLGAAAHDPVVDNAPAGFVNRVKGEQDSRIRIGRGVLRLTQ
ncbi:MAG: hypothetical protein OXT73_03705 [Bacteroidota bacterium]|nr:hypothetical protein [Bacteroidota bacterium]